jgi:hypothetical protein
MNSVLDIITAAKQKSFSYRTVRGEIGIIECASTGFSLSFNSHRETKEWLKSY